MINLNEKEKREILKISEDFIRIHGDIMSVEESIKQMEIKSSTLIQDLEACREMEKNFTDSLEKKYGDGRLDISGLKWEIFEIENEILK
jgi:hypothetical protein